MPLPRLLLSFLASTAALASGIFTRLQVQGPSMIPALGPGDRVLVLKLPTSLVQRFCPPGQIVACQDPRGSVTGWEALMLIKRVHEITSDGRFDVRGDNEGASTDSREFGPLDAELVIGRVVYIYRRGAVPVVGNLH